MRPEVFVMACLRRQAVLRRLNRTLAAVIVLVRLFVGIQIHGLLSFFHTHGTGNGRTPIIEFALAVVAAVFYT